MNNYGHRAMEYWARVVPSQFRQVEDPQEFFTELGEQVASQVEQISRHLEASLPPNLEYLERVGQLTVIRMQAEEVAFNTLVYWVTPEPDPAEELDQMLGELPGPQDVEDQISQIWDRVEQDCESMGSTNLIPTEQEQEMLDRLQALLPLVSVTKHPREMDEAELAERIQVLRPHYEQVMAERQ